MQAWCSASCETDDASCKPDAMPAIRYESHASLMLHASLLLHATLIRHVRQPNTYHSPAGLPLTPQSQQVPKVRTFAVPNKHPISKSLRTPRANDGDRSLHSALSVARVASGESGNPPIHAPVRPAFGCLVALVVAPAEPATLAAFLMFLL
jgi:hypothetical protein